MALAIIVALATQFVLGQDIETFRAVNFFSYFTVLSNVMAVLVLGALVLRPQLEREEGFTTWRGAVTLYMGMTGLVYLTLLLPLETDVGISEPWIDWVIHGIGPIFLILDWALRRPNQPLKKSVLGLWVLFPAAYLVYTLVRGPSADWYPYPFLDPRPPHTYLEVAIGSAVVLGAILAIGTVLIWMAKRKRATHG